VVSAPTQSLDSGQIVNVNGLIYQYDVTRSLWKSVYEMVVPFASRRAAGNYLPIGSEHSDINSGYVGMRNGIITGVSASVGSRYNDPSAIDKTFRIRLNQSQTDEYVFTTSGTYYTATDLNIQFSQGDLLQVYVDPGAMGFSPRVNLHISWRV
jgi:hypothetical protein